MIHVNPLGDPKQTPPKHGDVCKGVKKGSSGDGSKRRPPQERRWPYMPICAQSPRHLCLNKSGVYWPRWTMTGCMLSQICGRLGRSGLRFIGYCARRGESPVPLVYSTKWSCRWYFCFYQRHEWWNLASVLLWGAFQHRMASRLVGMKTKHDTKGIPDAGFRYVGGGIRGGGDVHTTPL